MADATRIVQIILRVVDQSVAATKSVTTNLSKMRSGTNAVNDSMMKQSKRLNVNNEYIKVMRKHFSNLHAPVKQATTQMDKLQKATNNASKKYFGLGLSMLFMGMALKKFATGALVSLTKTYTEATGETSTFNMGIQQVGASLEFVKFAIIDAFSNSDLFLPMIEGVLNFVNGLGLLISEHPRLATTAIIMLGIAWAVGTIISPLGQVILLAISLAMVFNVGLGTSFLIILAIAASLTALAAVWSSEGDTVSKVLNSIIALLVIVAITVFLAGAAFLWLPILIVAVVVGIIAVIWKFKRQIWIIFQLIGVIIAEVFIGIALVVAKTIRGLVAFLVTAWNKLRAKFGKEPIKLNLEKSGAEKAMDVLEAKRKALIKDLFNPPKTETKSETPTVQGPTGTTGSIQENIASKLDIGQLGLPSFDKEAAQAKNITTNNINIETIGGEDAVVDMLNEYSSRNNGVTRS